MRKLVLFKDLKEVKKLGRWTSVEEKALSPRDIQWKDLEKRECWCVQRTARKPVWLERVEWDWENKRSCRSWEPYKKGLWNLLRKMGVIGVFWFQVLKDCCGYCIQNKLKASGEHGSNIHEFDYHSLNNSIPQKHISDFSYHCILIE